MKNKHTSRRGWRTLALLLCFCLLCLPLMGAAAQGIDNGEPEPVVIDIVPENDEAPNSLCICEEKCADDAPNTACPVCSVGVEGCTGQEPTPAPVCNCETKCAADAPNTACPVCSVSVEGCAGQEPTPAPVCNCETKCAADAPNTACPICSVSAEGCAGQEPPPAPVCNCESKCAADAPNTACPVCAANAAECLGKPEPSFTIRILRPSGWYTEKAAVTIRVKDENNTGWKKVEVKIEKNGSWQDLTDELAETDKTEFEISENCTLYVTVTDKDGKAHTKNAYIECFDREAPTVRAGIDGALLRVEASDALSGVECIYINGHRFTDLTNGTLDVRLKDYADEYEQMSVVAVDYAGNRSKTVQVKNPYYGEDEDTPTTPTPTPVTTPAPTPATTTKPATGSGGQSATTKPTQTATPTASAEEVTIEPGTGFTENGNAVTRDLLYDKHANKQFITVETKDGNIFYVVIDYDKPVDEDGEQYYTYFLNLVDNADLTALLEDNNAAPAACSCAEKCGAGAVNVACPVCAVNMSECVGAEPAPEPDVTPDPAPAADAEPVEKDEGGGAGLLILAVLAVLAAGGAGYYFKVYRPKQLAAMDDGGEYEDGEPEDGGEWDDINADEDDSPPWDEDEGDAE